MPLRSGPLSAVATAKVSLWSSGIFDDVVQSAAPLRGLTNMCRIFYRAAAPLELCRVDNPPTPSADEKSGHLDIGESSNGMIPNINWKPGMISHPLRTNDSGLRTVLETPNDLTYLGTDDPGLRTVPPTLSLRRITLLCLRLRRINLVT